MLKTYNKKKCTSQRNDVFKEVNRLKNAIKFDIQNKKDSFYDEFLIKSKTMNDLMLTERTEEVFVNGHRYICLI